MAKVHSRAGEESLCYKRRSAADQLTFVYGSGVVSVRSVSNTHTEIEGKRSIHHH